MNDIRIAIVSPQKRRLEDLTRALHDVTSTKNIFAIESTLQQTLSFAEHSVPDILIVDSHGESRKDLDRLEQLGRTNRNMVFILLCDQQSPDFLIQAMRAGVREVLSSTVNADILRLAVERIRPQLGLAPENKGKVLAFVSCKGGSGATFLASNLAYALASQGKKVALIDCHLQFGDALLFLTEQKPVTTLSDVARSIHRLDPAFLASSMVNVAPNLNVLAAPEDPAQGMEVTPDHIDALLRLTRSEYDFVIIDVSRTLDAQTIKVLDHADMIYAVLQLTLPYIRDGKRLLDIFETLDYPKSKVQLIVNRYQKGGNIGLDDLEKSCGMKAERTVPNHYEAVAASVNQGVPIAKLAQTSPVTKVLAEWSESLTSVPVEESSSWLSRVFKRGTSVKQKVLQAI